MIVISEALALALALAETQNQPQIGYQSLVTIANITATEAAANYPATNLANPATSNLWRGATAGVQYLTSAIASADPVDYVGLARHNCGSASIAVSVEGDSGGGFVELVPPAIPADDAPLLFRFAPGAFAAIRLKLAAGAAVPFASVMYVGKLLGLQRNIYVGHTPIDDGREDDVSGGISQSGQFLGRIITGSTVSTSISLRNLTPDWERAHYRPFRKAARERPFFWAWRPGTYPDEVGFVQLANNPRPYNQRSNGMMAVDLDVIGVA